MEDRVNREEGKKKVGGSGNLLKPGKLRSVLRKVERGENGITVWGKAYENEWTM